LQLTYRDKRRKDGHLYYDAISDTDLELKVERLRDELAELRRAFETWQKEVLECLTITIEKIRAHLRESAERTHTRILAEEGVDQALAYVATQRPGILEKLKARAIATREKNRADLLPLLKSAQLEADRNQPASLPRFSPWSRIGPMPSTRSSGSLSARAITHSITLRSPRPAATSRPPRPSYSACSRPSQTLPAPNATCR
jgi:hypothetical protein